MKYTVEFDEETLQYEVVRWIDLGEDYYTGRVIFRSEIKADADIVCDAQVMEASMEPMDDPVDDVFEPSVGD